MSVAERINRLRDRIKSGSYVRLSGDLSKSIKGFGGSSAKTRMQGTVQRVYKKWNRYVSVEENNDGTHWTIYYSDIDDIVNEYGEVLYSSNENKDPLAPPELFDPTNLIT